MPNLNLEKLNSLAGFVGAALVDGDSGMALAMVGGGNIKGGIAYGSTNADGTEPKDNPAKIGDLYATLFAGLGIEEGHGDIRDNLGRPRPLAANPLPGASEEKANPIKDLIG